jgi:hypothetical protein
VRRPGRRTRCRTPTPTAWATWSSRPRARPGYFGWSITGDTIRGTEDAVALYIEDLAAALGELGWISPGAIHWDRLPFGEDEAAEALRVVQRAHGWDV